MLAKCVRRCYSARMAVVFRAPLKMLAMPCAVWCLAIPAAYAHTPVLLLEGKLTFDMQDGFTPNESRLTKKVIAAWKSRKSDAWGVVSRGTMGLEPEALGEYLSHKAEDYAKDLSWLPRLTWLKKETVALHGRKWADLRFIGQRPGAKGPMDGMLYTRILATSYHGQLLEIVFTSNTDRDPATKLKIDRIFDSVRLED